MAGRSIAELVAVAPERRDLAWLMESLQSAVELELSTIPPYLCALWSIKAPTPDDPASAYALIRSVVLEEMLHMGLASNLLATIGGTPDLTLPSYPGHLPGGVHPHLTIGLGGLTKDAVKVFMQIELPEKDQRKLAAKAAAGTYPTIGAFYDAITQGFADLGPSIITGQRQLTIRIGSEQLVAIHTTEQAQAAITEIKEQGEGTSGNPQVPVSGNELAHYFKFGEIYHGKGYVDVDGHWDYTGPPVPFPDAWPMLPVPEGGYPDVGAVQ
ncbi:MAG: ferritin-like domain-containing protein, partial [Actinomycetota bacterium]